MTTSSTIPNQFNAADTAAGNTRAGATEAASAPAPASGSASASAAGKATPPAAEEARQIRTLSAILGQCKSALGFVFLLTFVVEMLSVIPMLYMLNMFDRVLSSRSEVTLVSLTVLVVAVYIFWSALEWIQRRMMVRISLRIDWDLASDVFDASFRRQVGRQKVNVHQVLGDLVHLRQFLTGAPLLALMSAPFAIFFIAFGALFHTWLALFALGASVLLLGATYLTQKFSFPVLRAANEASAEASRLAAQSVRQAETALALGMQDAIRRRWYQRHQGFLQMQVQASESAGMLGSVSGFLTKSLPSLQMALGVYLAIEGLITGGMVIAASFLISKAIAPIQKVLGSWKELANAREAWDRLDKLLVEDDASSSRMELPAPIGNLSVSDLSAMPLNDGRFVLNNIGFSAEAGTVVAVVGPSAAGKSSLARALVGLWRPNKGSVRLDGAEISDWAHEQLGRHIGYVPQEIDFFEATVAENIARLGEVDSDKVVAAARLAGMHEIILTFPLGYDTRLGDSSSVLTGGQKQRLAIARALYDDPCYVVMDEPNANLDESGERALIQAIRSLKSRGATVIFTTHRPDLVNVADFLLVLNGGRQVGFGSVSEMLSAARKMRDASAAPPSRPEADSPNMGAAA